MSNFSVGSCLNVAFSPPQGTRLKILMGYFVIGLFTALFQHVARYVFHDGIYVIFAVLAVQNILIQPLYVGVNMFAVRSQWHDNAHTVPFRRLFSAYEQIVPLGIIAILLSVPSVFTFKFLVPLMANENAIGFFFHQHSWFTLLAMLIFGVLFLIMLGIFLQYVQLLIVDKKQSIGESFNSAFHYFLNVKVLFTVTVSYLLFIVCLTFPFVLTLVVLHFAGLFLAFLVGIAAVIWFFYSIPGIPHLICHPYARLLSDSSSTDQGHSDDEELEDEDSVNESESDSQSDNEDWIQGK